MARVRNTGGHAERMKIATSKVEPGEYRYSDYFHKENGERARLIHYDNCYELDFFADPDYWQHTDWDKYAAQFPQDRMPTTWFGIALKLSEIGFEFDHDSKNRWGY